jgi:hypothetical protein
MQQQEIYIGFPPLPDEEAIVESLLNDPPEVRWRTVRQLFRIRDPQDQEALIRTLQPHLGRRRIGACAIDSIWDCRHFTAL